MERNDLTDSIAVVLKQCRDDGMVPPFTLCAVSPNGSVYVSRFVSGHVQPLAEHYEDRGFSVPMTIVVLDQENTAAKMTLEPDAIAHH